MSIGSAHVLFSKRVRGRISQPAAAQVRKRFEALGPTYVKLGQLVASSPGVFPKVLANELQLLLDRATPADSVEVRKTLYRELGEPVANIFSHFDFHPLASASIAQVHAATLITGERVVVKIQRPAIRERIVSDTRILSVAARMLELFPSGRMLAARDIVEDFTDNLFSELDFRNEAAAMTAWAEFVGQSRFADHARVPVVFGQFTTANLLVMEHIDGVRVDDVNAVEERFGGDSSRAIRTLLLVLLDSIFKAGVFHGDLHAGNVLVDRSGALVFLDWGIVGRFDADRASLLRKLIVDLVINNDLRAAGGHLVALGAVKRSTFTGQVVTDLRSVTEPLSGAELGNVSYQELGKKILELGQTYGLRLPRDLVLVAKQLLYVERYMKLLAPKWKPVKDSEVVQYLAEFVLEEVGE
ncbi:MULTISPECIES: AarF/ABC1/UbiB kinase family protein [Mycobacteroides]|nr:MULTISPECIES: AarF/UbiB family protein [Mycobacteroides]QQG88977.1 AarF/ABC1/UbiB kinase family protein [Mycobacteroides chelonae]QQG93791.1 AarF/ABC1/UbiB kinase family protein [Mycobacteroides chelonae]